MLIQRDRCCFQTTPVGIARHASSTCPVSPGYLRRRKSSIRVTALKSTVHFHFNSRTSIQPLSPVGILLHVIYVCILSHISFFAYVSLCRAGHYLSHPVFSVLCHVCQLIYFRALIFLTFQARSIKRKNPDLASIRYSLFVEMS